MKILIYGINFSPELTGIGKYTGEMSAWLAKRGHEVRVVTAPPYYPNWLLGEGYKSWRYSREEVAGASVWRSPLWVPKHPNGRTRLAHLASFAAFSAPVMSMQIAWKPDVVFVIAPSLFCAASGLAVAKATGALACLHIQDFEVDAAFDMGIIKNKKLERLARDFEQDLYSRFDWVSSISTRMVAKLRAKGVSDNKIRLFKNWVDCDEIRPLSTVSRYRRDLSIPSDTVVAMYSGAMGEKQGIELIIAAAQRLAHKKNLLFVVAGSGPAFDRFKALTAHLSNLSCQPLQPFERLNEWLNLADIHLIPQKSSAADLVMPSKLTGMAASGRPIVAVADTFTELGQAVKEIGLVAKPDSAADFTRCIEMLAADKRMRLALGERARQFALTEYQKDVILGRLEQGLQSALAPNAAPGIAQKSFNTSRATGRSRSRSLAVAPAPAVLLAQSQVVPMP